MGTGASKGDNVVKFEDSEDDYWSGKQSDKKPAREDKKETSVLGRVFNKSKPAPANAPPQKLPTRKIVGESSSSSDEEDEYYRDVQLRKDIHQLERALNTVDTELENKGGFRHRHKQEGRDISAPVLGAEERLQLGEEERLSVSHGPGLARDRAKYRQARKKSDLKFSWEERDRGRMGEDWSLQKVKIEGFDPAKFKAANKAGAGDGRAEVMVTAHISQHSFRPPLTSFSAQPPGFVPTYDHSEQQLLASLERELGV